jgi:hypothetical protein
MNPPKYSSNFFFTADKLAAEADGYAVAKDEDPNAYDIEDRETMEELAAALHLVPTKVIKENVAIVVDEKSGKENVVVEVTLIFQRCGERVGAGCKS